MDISDIIKAQIEADRRRGFAVDFSSVEDRLTQLERDTVGLAGEVGEFANALKKVRLSLQNERYQSHTLEDAAPHLREELADAMIYLIRLSYMLNGDIGKDVQLKMRLNNERYSSLED